jgi:hypothetical protein
VYGVVLTIVYGIFSIKLPDEESELQKKLLKLEISIILPIFAAEKCVFTQKY